MRAVVIGASAGLGLALAEELARRGDRLLLVARDGRDLDASARDLSLRYGTEVDWLAADLGLEDASGLAQAMVGRLGGIDAAFLVAGLGDDADDGAMAESLLRRLAAVNFTGPVAVINALLPDLLRSSPEAHLIGIGSVAAIRGRSRNMVYGAAKRGLEFYFEALRHRLSGTGCSVQFYRVGFMDTTMLGNRTAGLLVASPASIARKIVARLGKRRGMAYLPRWWGLIALGLRLLPWALYRRLKI
ncbi:Short-chain dehydrogenase/reductase SDR [Paramagnetospirillum magnetotacticum MS-1]|uniref:Short-chain dehydrogenase/reductase SDR n=1 Tax=Paramagnetospirillum magnetotacticum MS-1 TaxID=272627 RepID=A0A0C2YVI0_PARME|nr:SDR family NAD(P)-dependent oxidoreductase [Paramagnetospirillum magnetotacticum]KIL98710.1 Short-chain dehydrogenase/reductase SDR [Paramagnetospirillum magnetotacticum MS-1]